LTKGSKGQDKKTRKTLKLKPGSLAWEQGKLEVDPASPGPETVYKVAQPPKYEVKSTFKIPKGYHDTGDTPRETIQTIGGPAITEVKVDLGATTAIARPNEEKIKFISNRRARLPGRRTSGITPKRAKLR
jgi:hypothetical protein